MRVNLLDDKQRIQINWLEILAAVVIILSLAGPALNYYINYIDLKGLERERNMWQDRLTIIRPQEEYYFELQEEIDNFKLPEEVEVERYAISPALQEFGIILPDRVGFERIDYNQGRMQINGHSNNINSLLDLVTNVYNSEVFSLVSIERFQRENYIEFNMEVKMHTREELPEEQEEDA